MTEEQKRFLALRLIGCIIETVDKREITPRDKVEILAMISNEIRDLLHAGIEFVKAQSSPTRN